VTAPAIKRSRPFGTERGAALLVILAIIGIGAAWLLVSALKSAAIQNERDRITADALAKAKDALIGYAATYRDTHPDAGGWTDKIWGYLPCPDTNNDGTADPPCGAKDVTVAGRLPWRTLGLPPLRDGAGECLWYVVSGRAKHSPPTDSLNWDTPGQIEVRDAAGQVLAAAGTHDTPWAVVVAPGSLLGAQDRTPAGASECGGNNNAAAYLEALTLNPAAGGDSLLVLATNGSANNGSNNDRGLWIASREIFDRIKKRSDFAAGVRTLLDDLKASLDAATPPLATAFATASTAGCPVTDGPVDQTKEYFRCNWNNNLRFAEGAGITVNGASCTAVLIFSGARIGGQTRVTAPDQANKANYLEAPNVGPFPGPGAYAGALAFDPLNPGADLVRCIGSGAPPPITGGLAIDLGGSTISDACPGCGGGIDLGTSSLTLSTTPAVTISAAGGTISRNLGTGAASAIGVCPPSGGCGVPQSPLQGGESLSFRLAGHTARKFGITLYAFGAGDQGRLTFKLAGAPVGSPVTLTSAATPNIDPGGPFDEVVVEAIGGSAFWVQQIKFCDASTSC
jgi:type II secretory pathway pseudopilin PulG